MLYQRHPICIWLIWYPYVSESPWLYFGTISFRSKHDEIVLPNGFILSQDDWWIGVNDHLTEGKFVYDSSQTPVEFVPQWYDYKTDSNECVLLFQSKWQEYDCDDSFQMGTLCEEI